MTRAGLLIAALILSFAAMVFAHRDPLHVLFRIGDEEGALADLAALGRPELVTAELHYEDGTRGRIYRPASGPIRGKQLVFHGMHRLGIDEPRLIILARAIAELGFEVHTPELEGLKNYQVEREEALKIAERARGVAESASPTAKVSIFAISFAGGLALLAFEDETLKDSVESLFLIGPYGDLERVLRFYAGEGARGPNGEELELKPHPYGLELLLRDRLEEWAEPSEREAIFAIFEAAVSDDFNEADELAKALGGERGAELRKLIRGEPSPRLEGIARRLIDARAEELRALSFEPARAAPPKRIYILHGAADRVIPPSESLHLERALGGEADVLITGAIRHAESSSASELFDRLALIRLMRRAL